MKRGFTLIKVLICIAMVAIFVAIIVGTKSQHIDKHEEMSKSGCRVIGYAGSNAGIKVYRCPGYDDVVTERDWQGPRTVEKQ